MIDVPQPPRPPFERAPLRDGRRVCPMCGDVTASRRGWWHRECAALWNLATRPPVALRDLKAIAGSRCWSCGLEGYVELEHIRPLWSLTPDERRELRWWLPFNQQLLCAPCHKAKSAREARERYDAQNPDTPAVRRRRDTRRLLEDGQLTIVDVAP